MVYKVKAVYFISDDPTLIESEHWIFSGEAGSAHSKVKDHIPNEAKLVETKIVDTKKTESY